MKHFQPTTLIAATASLAIFASASQAQTLPTIPVWDAASTSAARVGPWGNGSATASDGRNGKSLLVTTRNFHEGMRFDLQKPIDIKPYQQVGFWRIRFQMNATQPAGNTSGRGQNRTRGAVPTTPPLTQLRLKLMLDEGALSGVLPVASAANARGGGRRSRGGSQWQTLLLPIRNMSASRGASGLVRRIVLTGDSEASFNLEQVALVAETDQITALVRRSTDPAGTDLKDVTLKPGRSASLVADVNGGTSDLIVAWNFDADNSGSFPPPAAARAGGRGARGGASAGGFNAPRTSGAPGMAPGMMGAPRVDAIGVTAVPNWPNEEQDYRVEVTISDRAGKKRPIKKSVLVKIRG